MKIQDLAYVLHRRPFRDTSYLIYFFTQQHGIVTAVCRGVRQKKLSLDCFKSFWIEYKESHASQLVTLYQYEPERPAQSLVGNQLYCGLYLNELLMKLLGQHDPYVAVFDAYQKTIDNLSQAQQLEGIERTLRSFEFLLLEEIGYGISLEKTHCVIMSDKYYYYHPERGFLDTNEKSVTQMAIFEGVSLLAMAKSDFSQLKTLKDAKRLIRLTLGYLIEKQGQLKSRALFLK